MNEYELLYILHPRLSADEASEALERVSGMIAARGGEVLTADNWGRRRLAYPIGAHFEGTYVLSTISLPAEGTVPLESDLRISEDVVRHMLIRGVIPYEGPPPVFEQQGPPRGRFEGSRGPGDGGRPQGEGAPAPEASEGSDDGDGASIAEAPVAEAPVAEAPEAPEAPGAAPADAPAADAPEADAASAADTSAADTSTADTSGDAAASELDQAAPSTADDSPQAAEGASSDDDAPDRASAGEAGPEA